MKSFNHTLSTSLYIFALLTISLTIFTPTVEAKLRSVSKRRVGQVDEPKEDRHLQALKLLGSNPSVTLTLCQGDCDKDEDCEGDLICYFRDENDPNPVPGCFGSDSTRTDYCILDPKRPTTPSPKPAATAAPVAMTTQAPVPATTAAGNGNGNAPSPTRPPSGPVSLSNFRLKLYWRQGYYWQEERSERKWCMRCRDNGCQKDEKSYIYTCSGNSQYFDFVPVVDSYVQIQIHNKDLCFQRSRNDIYMKDCDDTNQDQWWFPKVGSFDGTSFEISPKRASNLCITQRHHPKAGEEVELESCSLARTSDTSKWNRY